MHPTVNPHSPHQLKALLYGDWSLPVQRSKQKNVSTDELALRTLMKFSPEHKDALFLLLQIRETKKLLGTFGQSALGIDRVHPSYLPVGKDAGEGQYGKGLAATGRLACSNPNLQQQPKEARHMYVPDNEGMYFVELDWSQAELRVAAHLSRDEAMLEALKGDIHAVTQSALGCDRTRAKNVVYGSAYGAGPKKLQEVLAQAGLVVSKDECASLQGRLAVLYPAWWSWRTAIAGEASARKYLRNPFGRLRRFLLGSDDVPAALDFLPQSVVADMGWTLYRPIWEEAGRLGGRLTTVVHDSFLVQLPIGTSYATLKALLEREFPEVAPGFYIPADAQVGPNWGEMEKA
jgi:DNA polymerase-1